MMIRKTVIAALFTGMTSFAMAGNPDRAGQAGANELLINPWARSSGLGGANTASVKGLESFHLNVAGLGFAENTELAFTRTNYLKGTDIHISNFGFAQRLGEGSVIGISVFSMDFGDIKITTVEQPDGTLGTFSPQFLNVGLGYAKKFSNNIYGGVLVRIISEAITDVKAQGIALDAGVQYQASVNPNRMEKIKGKDLHFGVSIRNIGPDMKFGGSGLSVSTVNPTSGITSTTETRAAYFNLPSLVNIGLGYDFRLDSDSASYKHRLTASFNFVSNTFQNNNYVTGVEYAFKEMVMIRGGFIFERDLFSKELRKTAFTGLNAGFGVQIPITKTGTKFGIDYSYRATDPFDGVHTFGARIILGAKAK
jgi:hypothetical protein